MKNPANLFIKPCPFCGSTNIKVTTKEHFNDTPGCMHIECTTCSSEAWVFDHKNELTYNQICHNMIKKWNRRVA